MQKQQTPSYKPNQQIEELIRQHQNQNSGQRRRTAVLPKRSWYQRNPRLFQVSFITCCLLLFFSRPIYDVLSNNQLPPDSKRLPPHKR